MATPEAVYNSTTTTSEPALGSTRWFPAINPNLDRIRLCMKLVEVLFSFVAFVLEEVVSSCISCGELYFFEFVSCTAFLFTLLLLILLSTPLHQKVGINCWPKVDFMYSAIICVLLIIASIVFATNNSGSAVEGATVAFGFFAAFAFLVDLVVFYRKRGLPFSAASNEPVVPEVEKLNASSSNCTN